MFDYIRDVRSSSILGTRIMLRHRYLLQKIGTCDHRLRTRYLHFLVFYLVFVYPKGK
jgi:hypothetical protein